MKNQLSKIKEQIASHTILLYTLENDGYKLTGSGVLVYWFQMFFVITASHVINNEKDIYVQTVEGILPLFIYYRDATIIEPPGDKLLDVGYLLLSVNSGKRLQKSHCFLPVNSKTIELHEMRYDKSFLGYLIAGYPEAINSIVKNPQEKVKTQGSALLVLPIPNPEKVYKYYKLYPIAHYIFGLKGTGVRIEESNVEEKIHALNGMSGCGIWFIFYNELKTSLDYKLIGSFTEVRSGKYQCAIACKINMVLKRIIELNQTGFYDTL